MTAVDDVSLEVLPGEFVVLLGPSGCGKTTLLRCVAGLERPHTGAIHIDGQEVFSAGRDVFVPASRRPVSMIFQSYALWPHMTVFENVAYPLRTTGVRGTAVKDRVHHLLRTIGLEHLAKQHPGRISGGEQQRVAVARALAADARVVLFDEPLSNVDAKVREQLRIELVSLQRELGFAALYVTHDQAEALELADRVAVLRGGRVAQYGPPRTVYNHPASVYVADFLGSANVLEATVTAVHGDQIEAGLVHEPAARIVGKKSSQLEGVKVGSPVAAVFRPKNTTVFATHGAHETNRWPADLVAELYQGPRTEYVVDCAGKLLRAWDDGVVTLDESTTTTSVSVAPEHVRFLPPEGKGTAG